MKIGFLLQKKVEGFPNKADSANTNCWILVLYMVKLFCQVLHKIIGNFYLPTLQRSSVLNYFATSRFYFNLIELL